MPACSASAAPVRASPVTTLRTPAGSSASSQTDASRSADSGVVSAGFKTTVLPQASAGAILVTAVSSGAFEAAIAPTTPSGRARSWESTAHASLSAQPAW